MSHSPLLPLLPLVFLTACARPAPDQSEQIADLKSELQEMQERIQQIEAYNRVVATQVDPEKVAFLTPSDSGFQSIASDVGILTVQITNVEPYANGSKVTLKFGNPHAATILGLKAVLDWGKMPAGVPDNAGAKSKDFNTVQALESGEWTDLQVVLEGLPPSELGFVRVRSLTTSGLRLSARR